MVLLNPNDQGRACSDPITRDLVNQTVAFFEQKGKKKLKEDYHAHVWYSDFLAFVKETGAFAKTLTPAEWGGENARWDTHRLCHFGEVLGFFGLQYWYTWQVSVLGLGPIWMGQNDVQKQKAARALADGGIFAFGLSEQKHGADLYATELTLTPQADGSFLANGKKYYIGNANEAAMVSTFGRIEGTGEYVFFAASPNHPAFECVRNVVASQNYVAEFAITDYPVRQEEILSRGDEAWYSALNTVNIGKFNLGFASIGICTHALYEAVRHAANRRLYHMFVTDFPHVRRMFTDAYVRLVAMKLFGLRAADYMRQASDQDRRYLLYNPLVKMKVTLEGERVIDLLWDVIAAKGFEKDTFFEQAAVDIRALPKLEGTVHVNISLIIKFMKNYFFAPQDFPPVPRRDDPTDDEFLFRQGPTRGLGKIRFHDYHTAFDAFDLPAVNVFRQQVETFKRMLATCGPNEEQTKDIDFLLTGGHLFALVVYAQLILENAAIYRLEEDLVDQIFDVLARDFSEFSLELYQKPISTTEQMDLCLEMIRKPPRADERAARVFANHVLVLKDAYEMREG